MAPHFRADEPVVAPKGLGVVGEYRLLKALAPGRALKVTLPGPLTFAGAINPGARTAEQIMSDLVMLVQTELMALAAAGAQFLQLDEPSFPAPPYGLSLLVASKFVGVSFPRAMYASLPIYVVFFVTIAFTVLFPDVVLYLPKLLLPESVGCFKNPSGTGYICPT